MKRLMIAAVASLVAFALVTYWALESSGVANIETLRPDGTTRTTHIWFASESGVLWLEAGTPNNPWYRDVLSNPQLTLSIDGEPRQFVAEPAHTVDEGAGSTGGHPFIRSLMREKYGVRDRWVGLIADTTESVAVRLLPVIRSQPPTE